MKSNVFNNVQNADISRRRFIKQSSMLAVSSSFASITPAIASSSISRSSTLLANNTIASNPLGFSGQRKDPVTGGYHLGHGYRMYNPRIMRFHAADSMSPFGRGGINSYAYCLGDPVNRSDPSGHFAIMTLIIGAVIGAALGLISGGFGAATVGARTGVQVGLAVVDSVFWSG